MNILKKFNWGILILLVLTLLFGADSVLAFYVDEIGQGIGWGIACLLFLFFLIVAILPGTNSNTEVNNASSSPSFSSDVPSEKEKKIFAENLRYYLLLREKTPEALVHVLHISNEEVTQWLNAEKMPDNCQKMHIAKWLDIKEQKLDEDKDHSDELIRNRTFQEHAILYERMSQFSAEKAEAAEKFVELIYNTYNGYYYY